MWKIYNLLCAVALCRYCCGWPRVQRKSVGRLTRRCDKKIPAVHSISSWNLSARWVPIAKLEEENLENNQNRIRRKFDERWYLGLLSLRSAFELGTTDLSLHRCFLVLVELLLFVELVLSRSGRGSPTPHNHLSAHWSAHLFRVITLNPQTEWWKQVKADYSRLLAPNPTLLIPILREWTLGIGRGLGGNHPEPISRPHFLAILHRLRLDPRTTFVRAGAAVISFREASQLLFSQIRITPISLSWFLNSNRIPLRGLLSSCDTPLVRWRQVSEFPKLEHNLHWPELLKLLSERQQFKTFSLTTEGTFRYNLPYFSVLLFYASGIF